MRLLVLCVWKYSWCVCVRVSVSRAGKKRWALYPPTHIPPVVTLVESEPHTLSPDGAYTSLQWYLEVCDLNTHTTTHTHTHTYIQMQ